MPIHLRHHHFSPTLTNPGPPPPSTLALHGTLPRPPASSPPVPRLTLSPPATFPPLSTGQLSGAAAERWQRALQMRGLRRRLDGLYPGPGSGRNAPGPSGSAPEPGRLPPQAGEGAVCSSLGLPGPRFVHQAKARAPTRHLPSQATHTCYMSFGPLEGGGSGESREQLCFLLVPQKGDDQPLRPVFFLLQEDYDKAESEASKGRGMWALVGSSGASVVGKDSGTTAPSLSLTPFIPATYLPSFFPTSLGISFSAATLTFSEAEVLSPTSVPPPFSGPRDLSLLLLPGDGGLMGADRAPVCAQPSTRTEGMSKHFIGGAKPWRSWAVLTRQSSTCRDV